MQQGELGSSRKGPTKAAQIRSNSQEGLIKAQLAPSAENKSPQSAAQLADCTATVLSKKSHRKQALYHTGF